MAKETHRTDPKLWETVKAEVTEGDKGGKPGQWSARKAQLAVNEYKHEGGGYEGERDPHNSLKEWGDEDWGTKSGEASGKTGERYLPKADREKLSPEDYKRTTAKKRADTKAGLQHSAQPADVAKKTSHAGGGKHVTAKAKAKGEKSADGRTKAELMALAKQKDVPGRSKMDKAALARAVGA